MAANIVFEHCYDSAPGVLPPVLVTASVDAINLQHSISIADDASISGQVVWTGTSSLDVRLELLQAKHGCDVHLFGTYGQTVACGSPASCGSLNAAADCFDTPPRVPSFCSLSRSFSFCCLSFSLHVRVKAFALSLNSSDDHLQITFMVSFWVALMVCRGDPGLVALPSSVALDPATKKGHSRSSLCLTENPASPP